MNLILLETIYLRGWTAAPRLMVHIGLASSLRKKLLLRPDEIGQTELTNNLPLLLLQFTSALQQVKQKVRSVLESSESSLSKTFLSFYIVPGFFGQFQTVKTGKNLVKLSFGVFGPQFQKNLLSFTKIFAQFQKISLSYKKSQENFSNICFRKQKISSFYGHFT